jgi:hypothetical protein
MATILSLAHGRDVREQRARMAQLARGGQPWKNSGGTFTGAPTTGVWATGRLPREFVESARSARYVIRSYATPIAWLARDGQWVVPDVTYSPTTSRHQSLVRCHVAAA